VEKFRGYRRDRICRKYGWFRHMAQYCRKEEVKTKRELREGWFENRWELLKCRVMVCKEDWLAAHSKRREAQQ